MVAVAPIHLAAPSGYLPFYALLEGRQESLNLEGDSYHFHLGKAFVFGVNGIVFLAIAGVISELWLLGAGIFPHLFDSFVCCSEFDFGNLPFGIMHDLSHLFADNSSSNEELPKGN